MSLSNSQNSSKAAWMLFLATSFWGTTFLLMKVLGHCQQNLLPQANTWFFSSISLLARFGLATLVLLAWNGRRLKDITRLELWQGLGLGFFGGVGLVLQMDGVQYTPASTSAFLTQCYCIFIPVLVALRNRKWPRGALALSCAMVLAGVAILANLNWSELRLGRGEAETILASVLFTGQILWLERPMFSANRSGSTTLVMFAVVTVVVLPITLLSAQKTSDFFTAFSTVPTLAIIVYLTMACTVVSFCLMNYWQPHLSSTHASLIYCTEPLFTSVFALFVPAVISSIAQINYPNEHLTPSLLVGGGLITAANTLMFWQASHPPTQAAPIIQQPVRRLQSAEIRAPQARDC